MKLHRFIGDFDLTQKEVEITDFQIIKQIRTVLRLGEHDIVILCDGKGREAQVVLRLVSNEKITGLIKTLTVENDDASTSATRKVHLYLAILKKENFELAAQKAVEAGVATITPIITERTVKTGLNIERLEKIIREASEQCGRSVVPKLSPILEFSPALAFGMGAEEKVIFHPGHVPYMSQKDAKSVTIFVGPEGGFTEKEIDEARAGGYKGSSLGDLILRGETAAIIATYRAVEGI